MMLENRRIIIDYVATDGDHQYDKMHEEFFEIIFDLHKSNISFTEMIKYLSTSNLIHIPISDFLHLLKNFRCNLVKYGIIINNKNSVSNTTDLLQSYQMGESNIRYIITWKNEGLLSINNSFFKTYIKGDRK